MKDKMYIVVGKVFFLAVFSVKFLAQSEKSRFRGLMFFAALTLIGPKSFWDNLRAHNKIEENSLANLPFGPRNSRTCLRQE